MTLEPRLGTGLEGFPAELWKRLRSGKPRLLMLDYDGTLAPFAVDRMSAHLPERSARALRRMTWVKADTLGSSCSIRSR